MKKRNFVLVAGVLYFLAMFGATTESYAYRKLDKESWTCAGTGGSCLPTHIVTPCSF